MLFSIDFGNVIGKPSELEYGLYRLTEPSSQFYARIPQERRLQFLGIKGPVPEGLVPTLGILNKFEVEPGKFKDFGVIFLYLKYDFGPAKKGEAGHFFDVITVMPNGSSQLIWTFKTEVTGKGQLIQPILIFPYGALGIWQINAQTREDKPKRLFNASFTVGEYLVNISVVSPPAIREYKLVLDNTEIGKFENSTSLGLGWLPEHKVSVTSSIEIDKGSRYHANPEEIKVASEGNYTFMYDLEHYVEVNSPFIEAKSRWYSNGESLTVETPQMVEKGAGERYVFKGWRGDYPEVSSKFEIVVNRPVNISAVYEQQFYLEVRSQYGNPKGEGWYPAGSEAFFSVDALVPAGIGELVFIEWTGDSSATTNSASITMDGPKSVSANWRTDYTKALITITILIVIVVGIVIVLKRRVKA
ncbi:MAG: InlB B-repeat-containing protein [Candidatus Bathyarchaeia archaeon]